MALTTKANLPDGDGTYMMVNLVARRARDINKQRVNNLYDEEAPEPMDVAQNEFNNTLLEFEFRHHLVGTGEDYRSN